MEIEGTETFESVLGEEGRGSASVWWRDGVLYQVYPRSFADSNGDGVGDLRGIADRLEYLAWLGVDGLWLNPIYPSPNDDWGYDVADYYDVHPELGSITDLIELVARAEQYGIRVILDLVPNHTSDQHPWFGQSRSSRTSELRDLYVWRDPEGDGLAPNDWRSMFGDSAWELDGATGQYYLHSFLPWMPDLNWWNPRVHAAFEHVLRFWLSRGIAGFRFDVAHSSRIRPERHNTHRRWKALCEAYGEPRVLMSETWAEDLEQLAASSGRRDDGLHLALNLAFLLERFDPVRLAHVVGRTEALLPEDVWPAWTLSNHDVSRFPTRWAGNEPRLVRCLLVLLMTLRGTPVLYYGDELGMPDTIVAPERRRDHITLVAPGQPARDRARTPMPWSAAIGADFTCPWIHPWLPFGNLDDVSVAAQREDADSPLHLCRDLIALRREQAELRRGTYTQIQAPDGVWAYRRGERMIVAINFSDIPVRLAQLSGQIRIGTNRARDGQRAGRPLELGPWEGAVVETR